MPLSSSFAGSGPDLREVVTTQREGKMMKRFGVSLAVCFAAMILGAVARAEPATYVAGLGQFSCSQFIATIGKIPPGKMERVHTGDSDLVSENSEYQQWLLGFVSGFNAAHPVEQEQQVRGIDIAGMDLCMRNWCNQHPTKSVFEGATAFINEMRSTR